MGLLRLLLALSVIADHFESIFGLRLVGGEIAVHSFFIISGFYMSLILNEKYVGLNQSYKLFVSNRFLRLFPIYWTVLILTIIASLAVVIGTHGRYLSSFNSYYSVKENLGSFTYFVLANIFLFGQDVAMFLGIDSSNGNLFFTSNFRGSNPPVYTFLFVSQAWTLGIELAFYLIAPFVLKRGLIVIIALALLSFLIRFYLYHYQGLQADPWSYRFFPSELMFFLLGGLSYRIYKTTNGIVLSVAQGYGLLLFILLITVLYPYLPQASISGFPFSMNESVYFILIIFSAPSLFLFFKESKFDRFFGDLSYPVYISHMLVGMTLESIHWARLHSGGMVAIATIVFSYAIHKLIALPVERYRQSRLTAG